MTCADVDAQIGYMTLLLARCSAPTGNGVRVFEALPGNAELARQNVAINRLSGRVIIEHLAMSDGSLHRAFLYKGDATFEFSLFRAPTKQEAL